jgi:hypothetical protein
VALNTDTSNWTHFASHATSEPPELVLEVGQSMLEGYHAWADLQGLTGEDRDPDEVVNGSGRTNFERYIFEKGGEGQSAVFQPLDINVEDNDVVITFYQRDDPNLRYFLFRSPDLKDWHAGWRTAGDENVEGMRAVRLQQPDDEGMVFLKLDVSTF